MARGITRYLGSSRLAKEMAVSHGTVVSRMRAGMSLEEAREDLQRRAELIAAGMPGRGPAVSGATAGGGARAWRAGGTGLQTDEATVHASRRIDVSRSRVAAAYQNNLALLRHLAGRFAESRTEAQRALALYPSMLAPRVMIALLDIEEGRTDRALANLQALEPQFPGAPLMEAMALARAGRREEALRLIRPLEEKRPDESDAMQWFALIYAFLGDEANTVKWLERSADRREFQVLNLAVHPAYAALQNSPGFRALKKRMGLDR